MGDIQDFKVEFMEVECNVIKCIFLVIVQVEVDVKFFWGNLYQYLFKLEFNGLGSIFVECEFCYFEVYV